MTATSGDSRLGSNIVPGGYGVAATSNTKGPSSQRPAQRPPQRPAPKGKAPKRPILNAFFALTRFGLVLGLWGAIAGLIALAWIARDLPNPDRLKAVNPHPSIQILAQNGEPLAVRGDAYGKALDFDDLPPHLTQALIATEDRRFYHHPGFDVVGIVRSLVVNAVRGHYAQGSSTLTQQLAGNLFLNRRNKTIERKIQELLMAVWLERRFSKDEILALYLNRMYFGAGAYGVESAAQTYFSKSARDLDVAESAMLMGLVQSPSRLSPATNWERAKARAAIVLDNMVAQNYLSADQAQAAKDFPAKPVPRAAVRGPQYFVDWIFDQIPDLLGEVETDIVVETTLDPRLQSLGEQVIAKAIETEGVKQHVGQGALLAMSPEGAVKAMVGGKAYAQSPFNRALDAHRQPGSAFKPFVYLAGLEVGVTPDQIFDDVPISVGGWSPQNYTRKYLGPITIRKAFAESVNTVAVRVFLQAGARRVVQTAHRLGITSNLHRDASLALGTGEVGLLELTSAYAPFANGGEVVTPYAIARIRNAVGDVLYEHQSAGLGPVIAADHLQAMLDLMEGVMREGTGKAARLPDRPAAGKTGTTSSYRDAWFMGFTADLVTGVWLGNDNDEPMKKVSGSGLPSQIWKAFMVPAHDGIPPHAIPTQPRYPLEDSPIEATATDTDDDTRAQREVTAMEDMDKEAQDRAAEEERSPRPR